MSSRPPTSPPTGSGGPGSGSGSGLGSGLGSGGRPLSRGPQLVPPGTVIVGTYEIVEHLSSGGFGEVYRGRNVYNHNEIVAIKIVLAALAHDDVALSLFHQESSALNRVAHDAVVRYRMFTIDPGIGRPCLVMDFVDGPSLGDRLEGGGLSDDEVLVLLHRLAAGLEAAHRVDVVHRDLSPDNVILPEGRIETARIIDFGIAKVTTPGGQTLIGDKFAGKPGYVAPEQLGDFGGVVTGQADVYSLGLVAAAAARGQPLDMGDSVVAAVKARQSVPDLSDVSERLRGLLSAMLEPDPSRRPDGMGAVIDEVLALQGVTPGQSRRPAPLSGPAPGETRSQPPQSAPPQSAPPQSVPPQSVPPQSAPPQSVPPQSAPPQSAPRMETVIAPAPRLSDRPEGVPETPTPEVSLPSRPEAGAMPVASAPPQSAPPQSVPPQSVPPQSVPPSAVLPAAPSPDVGGPDAGGLPPLPGLPGAPGVLPQPPQAAPPPPAPPPARRSRALIWVLALLLVLGGGGGWLWFSGQLPPAVVSGLLPPSGPTAAEQIDWLERHLEGSPAECRHVQIRAIPATPGEAVVLDGFAADPQAFAALRSAFTEAHGIAPELAQHRIEEGQCAMLDFLTGIRPPLAPSEPLRLEALPADLPGMGQGSAGQAGPIEGRLAGIGEDQPVLFLLDPAGRLQNATSELAAQTDTQAPGFRLAPIRLAPPAERDAWPEGAVFLLLALASETPLNMVQAIPATARLPAPQVGQFWELLSEDAEGQGGPIRATLAAITVPGPESEP